MFTVIIRHFVTSFLIYFFCYKSDALYWVESIKRSLSHKVVEKMLRLVILFTFVSFSQQLIDFNLCKYFLLNLKF